MEEIGRICLLNVGNTRTQIQVRDHDTQGEITSLNTESLTPDSFPFADMPVAAASVAPSKNKMLQDAGAFLISSRVKLPFRMEHKLSVSVGADRLANAAMLAHYNRLPAICIDFGTAINSEYVDETGCFRGGAILPGRQLMRRSLSLYTEQLPMIPMTETMTDFPASNTTDALRLGTDTALIAAVKDMICSARKLTPGQPLRIVACGGDRAFFLTHISGMEDGGDAWTLAGIKLLWEYQHES